MYAAHLRHSPIWSPLVSSFASPAPIGLNLRESNISPHDLAIPVTNPNTTHTTPKSKRTLHVILLTTTCLPPSIPPTSPPPPTSPETAQLLERLTHFHALTGGRDLLILFLLTSSPPPSTATPPPPPPPPSEGLAAHSHLQSLLLLHNFRIPVSPIPTPSTLVPTLHTYLRNLSHYSSSSTPPPHPSPRPRNAAHHTLTHLLPLCTALPPPHHRLSEHQVLRLTDCVGSLRELAGVCGSEEGREWLAGRMDEGEDGEGVGKGVGEFWGVEFVREV